MSLEVAITRLEAAVTRLCEIMLSGDGAEPANLPSVSTASTEPPAPEAPKTRAPRQTKATVETPPASPAEAVAQAKAAAEAVDHLDYDKHVAPLVLQCVSVAGRDKAVEILHGFGVAQASKLPKNAWPELIKQLKEAIHSATAVEEPAGEDDIL